MTGEGREELGRYFEPYVRVAADRGVTAVFDTPTWRANADWGAKLGYGPAELDEVNRPAREGIDEEPRRARRAVELDEGDPEELAERHRELHPRLPNVTVVGGCCGTDYRHIAAIADAWLAV